MGRHTKRPLSWIFLKIHIWTRFVTIVWDFYLKYTNYLEILSYLEIERQSGIQQFRIVERNITGNVSLKQRFLKRAGYIFQNAGTITSQKNWESRIFFLAWGLKCFPILFRYEN